MKIVLDNVSDNILTTHNGGSQEQILMLADGLVRLGHSVTIRSDDATGEVINGVRYEGAWMPLKGPCDIYAAQRDYRVLRERYAPLQVLLCHDIPVPNHWPPLNEIESGALGNIDGVQALNEWQRQLYAEAGCPPEKQFIVESGVDLTQFDKYEAVAKIPGRCVYCSHPNRGIRKLRDYWPKIKEVAPHATLQPVWWDKSNRSFFIEEDEQLGILPTKICTHEELALELCQSEIFSYPCVFKPEIAPLSCIKAQIAGAVPIILPIPGLLATLGPDSGHVADDNSFPVAVGNALNDHDWRNKHMIAGMGWARKTYDGATLAERFLNGVKTIANE